MFNPRSNQPMPWPKGKPHDLATRQKQSIANTKHTYPDLIRKTNEYTDFYLNTPENERKPISIAGLACYIGIDKYGLLEKAQANEDLTRCIKIVETLQEKELIENGLENKNNSKIAMLILKSKYGYNENPNTLTQNNYMNISPEVLATALERINKKTTPDK